eukprot:1963000-Rhodomonas_salina.1
MSVPDILAVQPESVPPTLCQYRTSRKPYASVSTGHRDDEVGNDTGSSMLRAVPDVAYHARTSRMIQQHRCRMILVVVRPRSVPVPDIARQIRRMILVPACARSVPLLMANYLLQYCLPTVALRSNLVAPYATIRTRHIAEYAAIGTRQVAPYATISTRHSVGAMLSTAMLSIGHGVAPYATWRSIYKEPYAG